MPSFMARVLAALPLSGPDARVTATRATLVQQLLLIEDEGDAYRPAPFDLHDLAAAHRAVSVAQPGDGEHPQSGALASRRATCTEVAASIEREVGQMGYVPAGPGDAVRALPFWIASIDHYVASDDPREAAIFARCVRERDELQALYPACCYPSEGATRAEQLYCANLRGGDPTTAGKNYQGLPCPLWTDLPPNIRAKWEATARL